jgi:hypothetical protein
MGSIHASRITVTHLLAASVDPFPRKSTCSEPLTSPAMLALGTDETDNETTHCSEFQVSGRKFQVSRNALHHHHGSVRHVIVLCMIFTSAPSASHHHVNHRQQQQQPRFTSQRTLASAWDTRAARQLALTCAALNASRTAHTTTTHHQRLPTAQLSVLSTAQHRHRYRQQQHFLKLWISVSHRASIFGSAFGEAQL